MNRQDNELRKRRAEEARQQKAEEIGRHMADRLEKTENVLLRELSADSGLIHKVHLKHPDLIFVGRIQKGELKMPWDSDEKLLPSSKTDRSGELILQAQQAEFSKNNLRRALALLNQALSSATSAYQKSFIKLEMGRVLVNSGEKEGALRLYKDILDLPGELTDEYGIPLPLFAADRLSVLSGESELVLDRLEGLLRENGWLPPAALYLINDITVQLEDKAQSTLPLDKINKLRQSVESGLVNLERIQTLKAFVTGWISRHNSSIRENEYFTWEAHGDVPWIVSIRDGFEDEAQYLFSFHGPEVLNTVTQADGLAETYPGSCLIVIGPDADGILPGRSFQGFRLRFEETGVSAWSRSSLPFPFLYWSILILAVGFTSFGMYLLWRDVRRELALADMRSHFAASVSHELKTPLTAIRMFAEALTMGVQKKPEAQQEYLQTIISESERLSRLLNNVLDFSKIEQGTRTYRFEPVSLENVLQAAARAMAFPMDQKGFNLQIETDKGIPQVQADKDALEQAVLNLLHNAVKYSGKSREILLKLYRKENSICIDVKDFGIGISDENKTHIFGKFFRVSGSENQRIPGTGLGLTIVSHIAEAHGGRVEVLSRPGEGSTFSIILPMEEE
jgi:signal transduction histidine kinase